MSNNESCYLDAEPVIARCVRCDRPLCSAHKRHRFSGLGLGPFFEDGEPRCVDCARARFWSAYAGMSAVMAVFMVLMGVLTRKWEALVAGPSICGAILAFSLWRKGMFERRAPKPERRGRSRTTPRG